MSNTQVAPATTFSFQDIAIAAFERDGLLWLEANQVCQALEYANPRTALANHVDACDVLKADVTCDVVKCDTTCEGDVQKLDTPTRARKTQTKNFVNESGLYALIFGSKKDSAKIFKRWVTSEVLPAIRKTGEYRATINAEQQRAIQEAVNARARRDGVSHQSIYHDLKTRYHIPRYSELPASAFADCLQWLGSQRQDRRIFAVRLMERGLKQYRERQDAIRTLSYRVAELGELAHILARELDHTRAALLDLERMGAIYDGLHEAQFHLGFPREILDAGRTEEWQ